MILDDCLLCVILNLPAIDIVKTRLVDKRFNHLYDLIDWQGLFILRVRYRPDVSIQFNWKKALVMLETKSKEVHAFCTWNRKKVRLMSPWKDSDTTFTDGSTVVIGSLKKGILRDYTATDSSQGVTIHFIYDRAFVLKGIRHTCIRRREDYPCKGCQQRKHCMDQKYKYYIRKLNHPMVDDLLGQRVLGLL